MNPQAPLLTLGLSTGIAFAYWWWIVSTMLLVKKGKEANVNLGALLLAQRILPVPYL